MFNVNPAFEGLLARHGLTSCSALVDSQIGSALRKLPTRENWRLDLQDDAGKVTTLYLKKHFERTVSSRFRALLRSPAAATAARVEAQRTEEVAAAGVPTMNVAAYAEELRADGTVISAFLTEELTGFEQLDLFLPRRFQSRNDPKLRQLVEHVAAIAGQFHRSGFNHRDFYTCHFFIREDGQRGEFAVNLIDLQRVQRWPASLRRRWIIKDLAQLAYSSPTQLIGPTERMRFFKRYLGVSRLNRVNRRLARAVLKRETALRRKHGPYRPEWELAFSSHSPGSMRSQSRVA